MSKKPEMPQEKRVKSFFLFFLIWTALSVVAVPMIMDVESDSELRTDVTTTSGAVTNHDSHSFPVLAFGGRKRPGPYFYNLHSEALQYKFHVGEKEFTGNYNPNLCWLGSCAQAEKIGIPTTGEITVYYSPMDPSQNWLLPPPVDSDLVTISRLSLLMAVVAAGITLLISRALNRKRVMQ